MGNSAGGFDAGMSAPSPLISGVTTTGGGSVFCGDLNGDFSAYDGRTGKR